MQHNSCEDILIAADYSVYRNDPSVVILYDNRDVVCVIRYISFGEETSPLGAGWIRSRIQFLR